MTEPPMDDPRPVAEPRGQTREAAGEPSRTRAQGAGMPDYLKEAFLFRWNLLFFLGGAAAAALTPLAPVLLPLVAAGEVTYLAGLVSVPRFRAAIDAKVHAAGTAAPGDASAQPPTPSLVAMLEGL